MAVILSGVVHIRNHAKRQEHAEIMAKYTAGDIIGFNEIDRGLSTLPDSWCHTENKVELALIDIEDFRNLWPLQNQDIPISQIQTIKSHPFFQYMSEQTVTLIISELIKPQSFKAG